MNTCKLYHKVTYSYGPPHMAKQKQDDQPELTYSSYVRTQDVTQKTCRRRWTIGKGGERWSRISVLAARHDDDDDITKASSYTDTLLLIQWEGTALESESPKPESLWFFASSYLLCQLKEQGLSFIAWYLRYSLSWGISMGLRGYLLLSTQKVIFLEGSTN